MFSDCFISLLYLLRLGLRGNDGGNVQYPHQVVALNAGDWQEVYRLALKHAVIGIAWDGVERLQAKSPEMLRDMPADLMGRWFADVQTIENANWYMAEQTAQMQERLRIAGFESVILKGAAFAQYYPAPARRQSTDIDLWVLPRKSDRSASLSVHRRRLIAFLLQQQDVVIDKVMYHHIETTCGHDTDIEFHVTPTWLYNPVHNYNLQSLFAQARMLTPDLNELYTIMHAFRHMFYDGISLRQLLDYYQISQSNRRTGVGVPKSLYRQVGLSSFAKAMDEVADLCFGGHDVNDRISATVSDRRAQHIVRFLPDKGTSDSLRWDYPGEIMFSLSWRSVHFVWRMMNKIVWYRNFP